MGRQGMLPEGVQLCIEGPRGIFRVCRPREDQTGPADSNTELAPDSPLAVVLTSAIRNRRLVIEASSRRTSFLHR